MQIILHIGQQKTASTAIQDHLAANRRALAAEGVLYPAALGQWKTRISEFMKDRKTPPAERERTTASLRAELTGGYSKIILSDETLFPGKRKKKRFF
jgi:hypothetical protein